MMSLAHGRGRLKRGETVGTDSNGSSFDGSGETMEEELMFSTDEGSILGGKPPFSIKAVGDLAD